MQPRPTRSSDGPSQRGRGAAFDTPECSPRCAQDRQCLRAIDCWIEAVTVVAPSAHSPGSPAFFWQECAMPVAVCCPTCWAWSELKSSMTCKRCGTPLVLPDGRRVDEAASGPPMMGPPPAYTTAGAIAALRPPPPVGFNWIGLARWMTAGYGALAFVGLLAVGFVTQYITVPVQDSATGLIVNETVNLR